MTNNLTNTFRVTLPVAGNPRVVNFPNPTPGVSYQR